MRLRPTLLLLLGLLTIACGRAQPAAGSAFRGVVLTPPFEKPDVTLTDTNGQPFNLRLQTAEKVTLLFFGYTHCPDVCPLHVANVAAVLKRMPFEERDAIRFVFVTTDPERDTQERLKAWLGNFDPTFVGLTGASEAIQRLQASLGMAASRKEVVNNDSVNYFVGHAAQVLAFSKDGYARVEYPFGIRQEDWANDLPLLARGIDPTVATPSAVVGVPESSLTAAPSSVLQVPLALMPLPPSADEAAVYATIVNVLPNDTLLAVWSPFARQASFHTSAREGGTMRMRPLDRVATPPGGTVSFAPGAVHVMLMGLREVPAIGASVPITVRFAKSGDVVFAATVVPYTDVERMLSQRTAR
jgi:cytochrome oxidase Cu insertion factor (SCO1/SenC/PrrC family)/copper(I)-binding protein